MFFGVKQMSFLTCTTTGRYSRVAASTLLAIALLSGCAEEAPPKPPTLVKAMQVSAASEMSQSVFPGRASAGQEANLSFRVPGPLVEFPVSVGGKVAAGDLIARIDPNDFEVTLSNAQAQYQSVAAAYTAAENDYQRVMSTFREDPGATSQRAVDASRALRDSAAAQVSSVEALVQSAQDRLSYTALTAPFDGEVVETYVENFETVIALQPIVRLLDPSSIELVISVPESLIGYADYVTGITVTFSALQGVSLPGAIKEIGREATQATRTYPVTLVVEQPEGAEILPGMAGEATIEARLPEGTGRTGITIPATATFADSNIEVTNVWVIDPDTNVISRRAIETGKLSSSGMLVTSGLEAGDWIVVAGTHVLSDGQGVKIIGSGDAQ
jgi:RND family efflux transporter MFP subunit